MNEHDNMRLAGRVAVVAEEKSLAQRFAKQILMSIIASIMAGLILNFTGVKKMVLYACATAIHVCGDPFTGKGGLVEKAEQKAGEFSKNHGSVPVPVGIYPGGQSPAKRERELNKFIARADAVGLEHDESWNLEKFQVEVPLAEERARLAAERQPLLKQAEELGLSVDDDWDNKTLRQKIKDAAERKPLLVEADELNLLVNDEWDNKQLKEEIKEERAFRRADGDYQEALRRYKDAIARRNDLILHGPNAVCPNGRCRHGLRFSPARTGKFVCPKCAGHFLVSQARASYVPPPLPKEPVPPKRKPSLLKRMFG